MYNISHAETPEAVIYITWVVQLSLTELAGNPVSSHNWFYAVKLTS